MATEIIVPTLGESVSEATISRWLKNPGESVNADEPVVELETDKVTLEVPAPAAGTLAEIVAAAGATVRTGDVLAVVSDGAANASEVAKPIQPKAEPAPAPAAPKAEKEPGPAARKALAEAGVDAGTIAGTGRDGRVTKADVMTAVAERPAPAPAAPPAPAPKPAPAAPAAVAEAPKVVWAPGTPGERPRAAQEERVRMTRLRQRIAERLKEAQATAAMLT